MKLWHICSLSILYISLASTENHDISYGLRNSAGFVQSIDLKRARYTKSWNNHYWLENVQFKLSSPRLDNANLCYKWTSTEAPLRKTNKRRSSPCAMAHAEVQFVTNKMCPFAQKAWITLEEKQVHIADSPHHKQSRLLLITTRSPFDFFMKLFMSGLNSFVRWSQRQRNNSRWQFPRAQVDYALTEISLYGSGGKPDWFLKMNPKGLVPVLRHKEQVVVESNVICR